jgi:cytidyltransferase-like protein
MKKVLVGGVFNILHPGHIYFLKKAKSFGDFLIVVVANDKTVLKNKGYLISKQNDRKSLVESLDFVDKVVIGDENDYFKVVEKERPDVIVLGYDQKIDKKYLEKRLKKIKLKCKLVRINKKFGKYSTRLIKSL